MCSISEASVKSSILFLYDEHRQFNVFTPTQSMLGLCTRSVMWNGCFLCSLQESLHKIYGPSDFYKVHNEKNRNLLFFGSTRRVWIHYICWGKNNKKIRILWIVCFYYETWRNSQQIRLWVILITFQGMLRSLRNHFWGIFLVNWWQTLLGKKRKTMLRNYFTAYHTWYIVIFGHCEQCSVVIIQDQNIHTTKS